MPFSSLGLAPALAQAATRLGFTVPTPIQAHAIPGVLGGRDLLATAPTGSGKTAAYALPLLQRWQAGPAHTPRHTHALVLVPTRELAAQVGALLRSLAETLQPRPRLVVAFGGVSINPQLMALRGGADVVVATPGRLLDLVDHNALRLGAVALLVLDEADRLLDPGFADELARVLALLPAQRQNLFFSATCPAPVEALARTLLREPLRLDLTVTAPDTAPDTAPLSELRSTTLPAATDAVATAAGARAGAVAAAGSPKGASAAGETDGQTSAPGESPVVLQRAIAVDEKRRAQLLRQLIRDEGWQRVLVFVATQHTAERLAAKLHQGDLFATSFHGGLSQGARQQTLNEFKEKRWDVLVTTDLAARGLHIDQLPVVVNFDLPRSAVDHVHRIGRTGRAGERGLAVSFVTAASLAHWRLIQKRQGLSLPLEQIAGFEPTDPEPPPSATEGSGGIKGKRPSKKDKLRAAAAAAGTKGGG